MQIEGEKVEAVTNFLFWGSKIIVDGDCSHEIKKTLAPWKKSNYKHLLLIRSVMSDSFVTPWTVARQIPLSMGFSR